MRTRMTYKNTGVMCMVTVADVYHNAIEIIKRAFIEHQKDKND